MDIYLLMQIQLIQKKLLLGYLCVFSVNPIQRVKLQSKQFWRPCNAAKALNFIPNPYKLQFTSTYKLT